MLLSVRDLETHFVARDRYDRVRTTRVLDRVSFDLGEGRILGLVGESGAGKSLAITSILGLLRPPARVVAGAAIFEGQDILGLDPAAKRALLGAKIGLVVQSPRTSLDPLAQVADQLIRVQRAHRRISRREAAERAEAMLRAVGVAAPAQRMRAWPHELSGGMAQRVIIAMAMINDPKLLVADEPTTGLDATVQAQILDLLADAVRQRHISALIVTHDLGVVAQYCDDVAVMFAGRLIERGAVATVFRAPAHPYTQALLDASPERLRLGQARDDGPPPDFSRMQPGCPYQFRCKRAQSLCATEPLLQGDPGHMALCHFADLTEHAT